MRLLVVQVYDNNFAEIVEACSPSVQSYCKKHGYSYTLTMHAHSSTSSWGKLLVTLEKIEKFDFVWSLDTDILILNDSILIENLIDTDADVNICGDGIGDEFWDVNAGSVVWKNSAWVQSYLNRLIVEGEENNWEGQGNWEQDFIQETLKDASTRSHFCRHHYQLFNHCGGDFLAHFCNVRDIKTKLRAIDDFKKYL